MFIWGHRIPGWEETHTTEAALRSGSQAGSRRDGRRSRPTCLAAVHPEQRPEHPGAFGIPRQAWEPSSCTLYTHMYHKPPGALGGRRHTPKLQMGRLRGGLALLGSPLPHHPRLSHLLSHADRVRWCARAQAPSRGWAHAQLSVSDRPWLCPAASACRRSSTPSVFPGGRDGGGCEVKGRICRLNTINNGSPHSDRLVPV